MLRRPSFSPITHPLRHAPLWLLQVGLWLALLLTLWACTAVQAAPLAYVPNEKAGSISVIDTETDPNTGPA